MNLFDITVALITVLEGASGYREGAIRVLVKLAGFILLVVAIAVYAGDLTRFARSLYNVPQELAVPGIFIVVLAIGLITCTVLAEIVSRLFHLTPLGFVDSGFGAVFGIFKGIIIAGILAFILSSLPDGNFLHEQYESSRIGHGLQRYISDIIPAAVSAGRRILHIMPKN